MHRPSSGLRDKLKNWKKTKVLHKLCVFVLWGLAEQIRRWFPQPRRSPAGRVYVDERVNAGSCRIPLQSLPKHFTQWRRLWNTLFLKKKKKITQIKLWNLCKKSKNRQTAVYGRSVTQFVVTSLRIEDVHCCALFCVTQWVYHGGDGTAFSTVACFSDESCTVTLAGSIRMESVHSKQCQIDELDPFGFSVLKDVFLFLCLSNLSTQRIVLLQFNPWNIMIHQLSTHFA